MTKYDEGFIAVVRSVSTPLHTKLGESSILYVGVFQPSLTAKDNDILFTTEGITQVIKGKLKENIPYDKIKINNEKSSIILLQKYYNQNINMDILINIIGTLRSKKYMEIKRTKGPSELRKALNEKMQDVFFF